MTFLFAGTAIGTSRPLVWDASTKELEAKAGETNSLFTFSVTNVTSDEVLINSVRTSCGCTVAKLPTLPWKLAGGADGEIEVAMDLRGKRGTLTKLVSVETSVGVQLLTVSTKIPEPSMRDVNQIIALTDRQAIFRNDCASCHVQPTVGKKGYALYQTACGICHEAEHRASMVPDLKASGKRNGADYWTAWVTKGKVGSLMPAFAEAEGGPLDNEQIRSLVEYLTNHFPSPPPPETTDFSGLTTGGN